MSDLETLLADLRTAPEGSREMSDRVLLAAGWRFEVLPREPGQSWDIRFWYTPDGRPWPSSFAPDPTVSIGAALEWMVPEGWRVVRISDYGTSDDPGWEATLRRGDKNAYCYSALRPPWSATHALALCIASLEVLKHG